MGNIFRGLALATAIAASVGGSASAEAGVPRLPGLSVPLQWLGKSGEWTLGDDGALTLTAGPRSDWFAWPGGGHNPDSSPRLLFQAASDFSFSTRVSVASRSIYDAGCIALYGSASAWAKFCLEAQDSGQLAIVSVVTRQLSDDVTSRLVVGSSVYLRVAKNGSVIFLYASDDGTKWSIIRKFNLDTSQALQVGFSVQSPEGRGATAVFSDYRYGKDAVNIWKLD